MSIPLALFSVVLGTLVSTSAFATDVASGDKTVGFTGKLGLQLFSLRAQFAKDAPGTLDKVHDMGFKYVEAAGTYGLSPNKFRSELDARGLKAISAHFPLEKFRDDV